MASGGSKTYSIREATLDDYEAVMAIDTNIYDGFNYYDLPEMYKIYLRDPRSIGFVLEIDDKISGFCMSYLVDDAKTMVMQASRIAPDSRATGLWSTFRNEATQRTVPTATICAVTSHNKEMIKSKIQSRAWQFVFILTRPLVRATLKPGSQSIVDDAALKSLLKSVDTNEAKLILLHPDNQWRLFPHGRIIVSWEPFKILPSNIDIITSSCHEILCTFEGDDALRCSTISLGHFYRTNIGMRYDIEIYNNDLQESLDHIRKHVNLSYKYHTKGRHCFWTFVPIQFDEMLVTRHIKENYPTEGEVDSHTMSLFETDKPASNL